MAHISGRGPPPHVLSGTHHLVPSQRTCGTGQPLRASLGCAPPRTVLRAGDRLMVTCRPAGTRGGVLVWAGRLTPLQLCPQAPWALIPLGSPVPSHRSSNPPPHDQAGRWLAHLKCSPPWGGVPP